MSNNTAGPLEAALAAWVLIGRQKPDGDMDIFRKADAEMRLIAAAPNLLAALEDCLTDDGAAAERSHTLACKRLAAINEIARAAIAIAKAQS